MGEAIISRRGGNNSVKYASGSAVAIQTDAPSYGSHVYKYYEVRGLDFKPFSVSIETSETTSDGILSLFWDKNGELLQTVFDGDLSRALVAAVVYDDGFALFGKSDIQIHIYPGETYQFYAMGV